MTEGDDPHAARLRAAEERRQGRTGDPGGREAPLGRDGSSAGENTENLAVSALTDQADLDKLIATGRRDVAPEAAMRQITGWDGLTPKEEEDARLSASRQQALAEYEREMDEIRERADRLDRQLDNWEQDLRKRQAEADANDIVLKDGRHVLVGPNNTFTDKESGTKLEGADEEEARAKKTDKSTTEEKNKEFRSEWARLSEAKDHAANAKLLAAQDGASLSPEQMKEREAQALKEQAMAEAIAKHEQHLETSDDNSSRLGNTDTLSALGLGSGPAASPASGSAAALKDQVASNTSISSAVSDLSNTDTLSALGLGSQQPARTASYIGATEPKDSRAVVLKEQFALNAQGANEKTPAAGPALGPAGGPPVAAPAP